MDVPILIQCSPTVSCGAGAGAGEGARWEQNWMSKLAAACRLSSVLVFAFISLWANYEASKGFDIVVLEAPGDNLAARYFNLNFVSNGGAARAILDASTSVESKLYPPESERLHPRKLVKSVTLRVAGHDLARAVLVTAAVDDRGDGRFVIHLSPSVIATSNARGAVVEAVHWGMARVWVNDGGGAVPPAVLEAVVEYLTGMKYSRAAAAAAAAAVEWCWGGGARFIRYCEGRRPGFVRRLNTAMQESWEEGMVDVALGASAHVMCAAYLRNEEWIQQVKNSTGEFVLKENNAIK